VCFDFRLGKVKLLEKFEDGDEKEWKDGKEKLLVLKKM
tara:strand:+ start:1075 stop:1188 length:114 start_codon:yes stop_codon:yes gene_type:complete